MGTNKLLIPFFCACLLSAPTAISAQIQLNIGYGMMKTQPAALNQIISDFNQSYGNQLVTQMPELKMLHGFHAELALFVTPFYVGVEWQNLTRDLKNSFKSAAGTEVTNTLHYANDMLSLHGSFMVHPNVGIGMTGDYNIVQATKKTSLNRNSSLLMYTTQWSSRFYLHLTVPLGDIMSLGVRPYVRIPWNSMDYAPIASRLNLYESGNKTINDKKMDFGIQIVWQNFLSPRASDF